MNFDMRLEIKTDPKLLGTVRALLRHYLGELGFSHDKTGLIVLAVDEACTNAIRHAYQGCDSEVLALTFQSDRNWVTITLEDHGATAPENTFVEREFAAPEGDVEKLVPGGLGVQLMYAVADSVDYSGLEGRGNRVTMRIQRIGVKTEKAT